MFIHNWYRGLIVGLGIICCSCSPVGPRGAAETAIPSPSITLSQVRVLDDGFQTLISTDDTTVGLALSHAGIFTYLGDEVTPPLDSLIYHGMDIVINRSTPISVKLDGETLVTRTRQQRVIDVFADLGISLSGSDYSMPHLDAKLPDDGIIRVVRVVEETINQYTPIPFGSLLQGLSDLEIDSRRLVQKGNDGLQAQRVRVKYEDGAEISRVLEDEWVHVSPTPRIIGYGMQINIRTIDTPLGPIKYWRKVSMRATSYSPARSGTPVSVPWYGLTRSGKVLKKGMVAVDVDIIPLGTLLYVPGYGLATAEDTGSRVLGLMIDLGFEDNNYETWSRQVTVYFRTPVPDAGEITWIIQ